MRTSKLLLREILCLLMVLIVVLIVSLVDLKRLHDNLLYKCSSCLFYGLSSMLASIKKFSPFFCSKHNNIVDFCEFRDASVFETKYSNTRRLGMFFAGLSGSLSEIFPYR